MRAGKSQALGISPDNFVAVRYLSDSMISSVLWNIAPTLLLIGFFAYMYRRESSAAAGPGGMQSIFSVGRSKAKMYNVDSEIKVRHIPSPTAGLSPGLRRRRRRRRTPAPSSSSSCPHTPRVRQAHGEGPPRRHVAPARSSLPTWRDARRPRSRSSSLCSSSRIQDATKSSAPRSRAAPS